MSTSWLEALNKNDSEIEIILPTLKQGEPSPNRIFLYPSKERTIPEPEPNMLCELVVHVASEHHEHATAIPAFDGEDMYAVLIRALKVVQEADSEMGFGY